VTGQRPVPGHEGTTVPAPAAEVLCIALQHYRDSRLTRVAVRFGDQGIRYPQALWPDCWHDTWPGCAVCWQATRQAPAQHRPAPPAGRPQQARPCGAGRLPEPGGSHTPPGCPAS
jgi:hypothetical protein